MKVVVFNNLVCLPAVLYAGAVLNNFQSGTSYAIEDLPTAWTLLWQNYFINFFEDVVFTCTHRILHTRFFYKHVHKLHHTYAQPVGVCAEYAHPFEFIFGNVLPIVLPITLLGKNLLQFTFLAVGTQRIIGTTIGHSGYDFPWDASELPPFRTDTPYHDFHPKGNIDSNYGGGLYLIDYFMGYNEDYFKSKKD